VRQTELRDALEQHDPSIEISFPASEDEACKMLGDATVLLAHHLTERMFLAAPHLKWVHMTSAGVDHSLFKKFIESEVLLTNSRGLHARTMAEWTLAGLLYWSQRLNLADEWKRSRDWKSNKKQMTENKLSLEGLSTLVVGYGEVARGIAGLLKSVGMRVEAIATRERRDLIDIYPMEQLEERLQQADVVVITLPLTPKTRGIFNRRIFPLMKPTSVLVNVARGAIVDEIDLIEGLKAGKPSFAILDVFTEEPLPQDSELFDLPNVFMTPHVSGNFPEYTTKVHEIFLENVIRYTDGQPLRFVVDKKRGY